MKVVVGGGARPGWGSSRQSLKNRFLRLCAKAQSRGDSGTCAVAHAEVGSDKPPTPKTSTPSSSTGGKGALRVRVKEQCKDEGTLLGPSVLAGLVHEWEQGSWGGG